MEKELKIKMMNEWIESLNLENEYIDYVHNSHTSCGDSCIDAGGAVFNADDVWEDEDMLEEFSEQIKEEFEQKKEE